MALNLFEDRTCLEWAALIAFKFSFAHRVVELFWSLGRRLLAYTVAPLIEAYKPIAPVSFGGHGAHSTFKSLPAELL